MDFIHYLCNLNNSMYWIKSITTLNHHVMKKQIFTILVIILTAVIVQAQEGLVQGTVTEAATDEPIIGANVKVLGTNIGTVTNIDGMFSLPNMRAGDKLEITYIGMQPQTVILTNANMVQHLNIAMQEIPNQLDEVVVTGYGTARKRDLTGSIVSISGAEVENAPTNNVMASLQGKVPGLMVTNTGSAGGEPDIKIRGVGTLNSSSNPLYVVDGMFTSDIKFLNNNDIESIEILKDPSSLAIFGVQGANGVIIITTKRADSETPKVTYDGYVGLQVVWNRDRLKLTNATEFTTLYNEMLTNQDPNAASWVPDMLGVGTDWQSKVLRERAFVTNHSVSISSKGKHSNSMLSLTYYKQDGVLKYNSYQRFNVRFAQDYEVSPTIKFGGNANISYMDTKPASANIQSAVLAVPTYVPYAPEEDWDPTNPGSYYHPSANIQNNVGNPVAHMEMFKGKEKYHDYRILGNLYGEWTFLHDFTLRATGYADIGIYRGESYTPSYDVNNATSSSADRQDKTVFYRKSDEGRTLQGDILLTYRKNTEDHRIEATAGFTARDARSEGMSAQVDSLASGMAVVPEDLWMFSMGSKNNQSTSDWWQDESFVSYLARVSYGYKSRYLLTATFRADGSSKFSPKNRWGYFPSVGIGWVLSDEAFMTDTRTWLDFAKLRVSWGRLGNDKIGNYLYYPTINPMGKQVVINGETVWIPTQSTEVDENIHWEVMEGIDVGLQANLFQSRLKVELGYFNKTTKDLLAYVEPSSSVGAGYAITNAGSIRNQGFEFTVGWSDRIGDDLIYNVNFNGGTLKNKVTKLGNNNADIISDDYHRTSVGHPVGSYYGYVQEGIFQNQAEIDAWPTMSWTAQPGDIKYKDLNGDGQITDADRTFLGSPLPTFTYGFNISLNWRGFDFAVDFNGVSGNKILDLKKTVSWTNVNFYEKSLQRWHGEGTSNTEPILDKSRGQNYLSSTNLLESGAYFRLRNMTLGYTIPRRITEKAHISNLRVYLSGQNMWTWKKNSGYTPEIYGSTLTGGADEGDTYPIPAIYQFGLSVNF